MKLYYSDVLSPRKACAVAKYLQLPIDYVFLRLDRGEHRTSEYLALNPNGKVPTLVDGERNLWEADAIMCHLAGRADSQLWPRDAGSQIEILRWFSWNQQHFTRHAGELYFEHIIKARFSLGAPDAAAVTEAQKEFRRYAAVLDAHLEGRRWLVDERLSVADFAVAIALPYAERAQIPLNGFPHVLAWHDRLCDLESWREPFPAAV
ncbi:MAG: glutathione S-transferase family protein [Xanthomonadaceae bacterium]|nr:glutathione S-transferase family protein [Xanthomonadaceae bacterium]